MTDPLEEEEQRQEQLFNPHVASNDQASEREEQAPVEFDTDPNVTRPWAPRSAEEGSEVDPAGRPVR